MNFVRVWLWGVIHPARSLDELKDKPAPQWGLGAVLLRFVTTALIEPFPLYVLGRHPSPRPISPFCPRRTTREQRSSSSPSSVWPCGS
jgi:hypothetical protein